MNQFEELKREIAELRNELREPRTVGEFEKVSLEQFIKDYSGAEEVAAIVYEEYLELPRRSSYDAAGFDFVATRDIVLSPGQSTVVQTGIRVRIKEGWVLFIVPRSGLGTRYRMQLNNTVGVIDGDYYHTDNEGHIMATITNDGNKELVLKTGDRFLQGVFVPYGITESDNPKGKRIGGHGSSGLR